MVISTIVLVGHKASVTLAAHPLISRPTPNNWARVTGKGNRWQQN
jgi:hypothetical protein